MSSPVPAQKTPDTLPKETLHASAVGNRSGDNFPVEISVATNSINHQTTTPSTEPSGSVDETTERSGKQSEETSSTIEAPLPQPASGHSITVDGHTPEGVKASLRHTYDRWTYDSGLPDYRPGFDLEWVLIDATRQLFELPQEEFLTQFEMTKEHLVIALLEDYHEQQAKSNNRSADNADTDDRSDQGEQEDSDSECVNEVEDRDYHDEREDEGHPQNQNEGQGAGQAYDAEPAGLETEEVAEGQEGEVDSGPDGSLCSDSDDESDTSDNISLCHESRSRKSKKRSRDFYETPDEKAARWQEYKKRKLDLFLAEEAAAAKEERRLQREKEENAKYHPFGKVEGLYLGIAPEIPGVVDDDSDDDLMINDPEDDNRQGSFESPAAPQPSRKRKLSQVEEDDEDDEDESTQPAKKILKVDQSKDKVGKSKAKANKPKENADKFQDTGAPVTPEQKWFLAKGKIKPGPVKVTKPRRGAKSRTTAQKLRGDWGTPKATLTKEQLNTIRKHAKYTIHRHKDLEVFSQTSLTHEEAIHLDLILQSKDKKDYRMERGDVWQEDMIIIGHLVKFQLLKYREIRKGKQARRQRLARGEDQDDESDLSDDDSKYDDNKATCGLDLKKLMDHYLARQQAEDAGMGEEFDTSEDEEQPLPKPRKQHRKAKSKAVEEDSDNEEDFKPRPPRQGKRRAVAKGKGKGRAVTRDDEEDSRMPRQKDSSKGKAVKQVEEDFGDDFEKEFEEALKEQEIEAEGVSGPSQAVQYQREEAESDVSEAE